MRKPVLRYENDKYILIYEEYTRPSRAINSFVTTMIELLTNSRLHMYRETRKGAAVVFNKYSHTIDCVCAIYLRQVFTGFCLGSEDAIKFVIENLGLKSVMLFRPYPSICSHYVTFRSLNRRLYFCMVEPIHENI